jgi:hypothetical protein
MDGRGLREVFMNEQRRIVDYSREKRVSNSLLLTSLLSQANFCTDTVDIRAGSTASTLAMAVGRWMAELVAAAYEFRIV